MEAVVNLLHINAMLQTLRAGRLEMLCVALFGRSRVETDDQGTVVLRRWRGRSYLWVGSVGGLDRRPGG